MNTYKLSVRMNSKLDTVYVDAISALEATIHVYRVLPGVAIVSITLLKGSAI